MSFEQIQFAMRGNQVWCRNGRYALEATPCEEVSCPFKKLGLKNGSRRLAQPNELEACKSFQITLPSSTWEMAAHVWPAAER